MLIQLVPTVVISDAGSVITTILLSVSKPYICSDEATLMYQLTETSACQEIDHHKLHVSEILEWFYCLLEG